MDGIGEFFTSGDEVWYEEGGSSVLLREGSPIIPFIIERVRELYPKAYDALASCYSKSCSNHGYYNFLIARRFIKCNFGTLDHTKSDNEQGILNLECVPCPLRGECKHEGIICQPTLETRLSKAERRVMRLVFDGLSNSEIAERLYLSPNTVKRHISTAYYKTHTRSRSEFIKYASDNNLFV